MTSCRGAKRADLRTALVDEAMSAGFDDIGFTVPNAIAGLSSRLDGFLEVGWHGDMDWMATTVDRRRDPRVLWPRARSVIALAMNYGPSADPLSALTQHERAIVSCYAKGKDYHVVVRKALKRVASWLHRRTGTEVKVFVDTAPLMEKPLAAAAGIGWQGKHTNLVSRDFGSWLFLGFVFTTHEFEADKPEVDHCGTCRKCLDICPTSAFPSPYQLDARRCISYLTIEHKGHIAPELRRGIKNRVFGCDDCLAVCPWNKFAKEASELRFHPRAEVDNPTILELLALDDDDFRKRFQGTAVKRTGRDRLVRNALIAAANAADEQFRSQVQKLLSDRSPLVRAMAVWAMSQIACNDQFERLRLDYEPQESDPNVRQEWQRGKTI